MQITYAISQCSICFLIMPRVFAALFLVLLVQVTWVTHSEGARILVVFSPPAPSHFFLGSAIVKELVNKGHDVTFINSFGTKLDNSNLNDIVLVGFREKMEELKEQIMRLDEKSVFSQFSQFIHMSQWMAEEPLNNTKVQDLLKSNEHFDLVIMETFLSEAHVGFAHHYNCPLIVVSTTGSNIWVNHFIGNAAPPSFIPQPMTGYAGQKMDFWQRTKNFLITYMVETLYSMVHLPQQDKLLHKYFPTAPSLREVINERVALMLVNSHPSIGSAKPSVPNMIEIGGYHLAEPKALPKNIKDYLDGAKQGFILFSMGSNLKSTMLPVETREVIMKVFAQLPYKILWKFEDDQLPGKPDNVKIDKWLPQNDILAHPNLKLFITHGGLLSTTEAVYHGVPIVGIPVFGDQKMNMAGAESLGIGKAIDFKEITSEKLLAVVKEVLDNKSYREAARHRSALFRDQPMRPIDSVIYWIEYVLRHKYSEHLKTGAIHLNWFQVRSLDVIAFLGSIVFAVVAILYLGVTKLCCRRKKYPQTKQKYTQKKKQ